MPFTLMLGKCREEGRFKPILHNGIDCSSLQNDSFGVVVFVSHVEMTFKDSQNRFKG